MDSTNVLFAQLIIEKFQSRVLLPNMSLQLFTELKEILLRKAGILELKVKDN